MQKIGINNFKINLYKTVMDFYLGIKLLIINLSAYIIKQKKLLIIKSFLSMKSDLISFHSPLPFTSSLSSSTPHIFNIYKFSEIYIHISKFSEEGTYIFVSTFIVLKYIYFICFKKYRQKIENTLCKRDLCI